MTKGMYCLFLGMLLLLPMILGGCAEDPTANKPKAVMEDDAAPGESADEGAVDGQPEESVDGEGSPEEVADVRTYLISGENSSIQFAGSKVTDTHYGGYADFEGHATLAGDDPTTLQLLLTIDMKSTYSDDQLLTDILLSDKFFDVEKYPQATFEVTGVEKTEEKAYTLKGKLDLHGVSKGISFPATIEVTEDVLKAEAEFSIDRQHWGIDYPGWAGELIRDDVLLALAVEAPVVEAEKAVATE